VSHCESILLPPPTAPHDVALAFVASLHIQFEINTLVYWRGDFYAWKETCWSKLNRDDIRAQLYEFTRDSVYAKEGKMMPWLPNQRRVSDLVDALKAVCRVPDTLQPPCWLNGQASGSIVSFRNGLLVIDGRELLPHTPRYFNLTSLPYDYDPIAKCESWDAFMKQLWRDDEEPVCALEEFLGCIVAGKGDLQRILVLIGPPRSGKSTILKVIEHLVGVPNAVAIQLAKLTKDNVLSSLIGKAVCLIPDIRAFSGRMPEIAEVLLSISGQDNFTIDRKYKDPWAGSLDTLVVMASNEFPAIRDTSGALPARYLPIIMTESWLGREDRTLLSRLTAELPGILNRVLDGLDHVIKARRFTEPKASAEAALDLAEMASPMKRFIAEHLVVTPQGGSSSQCATPTAEIYRAYQSWAQENGEPAISKTTFGLRLRAALPLIKRTQPRGENGERISSYSGVILRQQETERSRAARRALAQLDQRAKGGVRVLEGGGDSNGA